VANMFSMDALTMGFKLAADPCGTIASVGLDAYIDLPGGEPSAAVSNLINQAITTVESAGTGALSFSTEASRLSISESVTSEQSKEIAIPVYRLVPQALGSVLDTACGPLPEDVCRDFNPQLTVTLELKLSSTTAAAGVLDFKVEVDLCVEISGVSENVNTKKCGAELPDCSPYPGLDASSPTFEGLLCYLTCAGFSLTACESCVSVPPVCATVLGTSVCTPSPDLCTPRPCLPSECPQPRDPSALFGSPPFEIVPLGGHPLQLDFSAICTALADYRATADAVQFAFKASGDVADFTTVVQDGIAAKVARQAGVVKSAVAISVAAGSVVVTATIAADEGTNATDISNAMSTAMADAASCSALMGSSATCIEITNAPTTSLYADGGGFSSLAPAATGGLDGGAIAGIVIGVLALLVSGGLGWKYYQKRKIAQAAADEARKQDQSWFGGFFGGGQDPDASTTAKGTKSKSTKAKTAPKSEKKEEPKQEKSKKETPAPKLGDTKDEGGTGFFGTGFGFFGTGEALPVPPAKV